MKAAKAIYIPVVFINYRIKINMLLIIYLGLFTTLTLVSGDCVVRPQDVEVVNFTEVGISV
jgi:hypothetical protein